MVKMTGIKLDGMSQQTINTLARFSDTRTLVVVEVLLDKKIAEQKELIRADEAAGLPSSPLLLDIYVADRNVIKRELGENPDQL